MQLSNLIPYHNCFIGIRGCNGGKDLGKKKNNNTFKFQVIKNLVRGRDGGLILLNSLNNRSGWE